MSKNSSLAKKESASTSSTRERIIPIRIEDENAPTSTSYQRTTRLQPQPDRKLDVKEEEATMIPCKEELVATILTKDKLNSSGTGSNLTTDSDYPERPVPSINVPERIIIVLDRSLDENYTDFELKNGKKINPLHMLQHAVQMFVYNKNAINPNHEFALVLLNDNSASWVHDFTSTPQDIIATLSLIESCTSEDIFRLNTLFEVINKHVTLPNIESVIVPYVVRAVLLYNRSYSIPVLSPTPDIVKLLQSPLFTFDVIMTHEAPSAANHCNKIFETLQSIDIKGFAYSFSVSRNSRDLHIAMGKMLGHSLQRPPQSMLNYDLKQFKM